MGMRAVIQGHSSVPNDCIVGALSLIEQHQTVSDGVQALIGVPVRASPPRRSSSDHPPVQSVWFQTIHWMLSLLTPFFVSFQLAFTIFFPVLLFVSWLQHHLPWAVVYALSPLLLLAVLAAAIVNLVITKWLYMLRLRHGEHRIQSCFFIRYSHSPSEQF